MNEIELLPEAAPSEGPSDGKRGGKPGLVGVRLSALDMQRLRFFSELERRAPSSAASTLLSDAIRRALHESTAPDRAA